MQRQLGLNFLRRVATGARFRVFALVTFLVLSQLAVACHQTAHFVPDRAECELCVCGELPLCAPLPTVSTLPLLAQQHLVPKAKLTVFVSATTRSAYHSRAPPQQA